jgi:hypothetical protein
MVGSLKRATAWRIDSTLDVSYPCWFADITLVLDEVVSCWALTIEDVSRMRAFDLIKATVLCGSIAFLVYSFPVISQTAIIGLLSLVWVSCAHQALRRVLRG